MSARRVVSNPLALAVLVTVGERPMHPYEMAATMRAYGKERSIKLNYGSLYTVVANLAKHGLIEAVGAGREGRRPERTVYRLTEAGRKELEDWMSELIAVPVKEYPQFEAALAELPVLPPDRALALFRERVSALEQAIADGHAELAGFPGLPRLFVVETEYHLAMREAELRWVRALVKELEDGTFPDQQAWQHWHETGTFPAEFLEHHPAGGQPDQGTGPDPGPAAAHPGKEADKTN
jgi:DNA-binding PadR family transcriptional regulator